MKLHPLTNHLRSYDASWNWGFGKYFFVVRGWISLPEILPGYSGSNSGIHHYA